MSTNKEIKKIGIILGSNRPKRICRLLGEWIQKSMKHEGLEIDLIDLAEINLPFLDEPELPAIHRYQHEHTRKWSELVNRYSGFVLLVPQYN